MLSFCIRMLENAMPGGENVANYLSDSDEEADWVVVQDADVEDDEDDEEDDVATGTSLEDSLEMFVASLRF